MKHNSSHLCRCAIVVKRHLSIMRQETFGTSTDTHSAHNLLEFVPLERYNAANLSSKRRMKKWKETQATNVFYSALEQTLVRFQET